MKYRNPIITGFFPDPSICRVDEDYYMVHSTFEYLPALPISHSRDLVHWEIIGHCITSKEQMSFPNVPASEGLYAPTIRYHDGFFYVVCTNVSIGGNFYITAKDPRGPWSEPIVVEQGGIDPSLLFDDDGTVYFTSNGWIKEDDHTTAFIQQSVIDITTGKLLTKPRIISYGSGGRCLEAPHLYHIGDWYYLMAAEGGTDLRHMVTVFRSRSPWGPFEGCPDNPILTARDEDQPKIQATGHADLIEDIFGKHWLVFLCYRIASGKYHHQGRETAMVPLEWDDEGWPYVSTGKATKVMVNCPERKGPEEIEEGIVIEKDDFKAAQKLGPKWNFMREFLTDYSLDEYPGFLTLYGNEYTLADAATPAWIGKRQQHFAMECRTLLDFMPEAENEEAGLSVVCSDKAWYALVLTLREGKRILLLRKQVEDMVMEIPASLPGELADTKEPIELYLAADRETYYFGYYHQGDKAVVGTGKAKLLSTEVNWGFTGVLAGVYATGNGKRAKAPAKFKYFSYQGEIGN